MNFGGAGGPIYSSNYAANAFTSAIVFGSPTANSVVELVNPVVTGSAAGDPSVTIRVNSGAGGDYAVASGVFSGFNGLSKTGTGMLVLTAAETYAGGTGVAGGTLVLAHAGATLNASSAVTISAGATLQLGWTAGQDDALGLPGGTFPAVAVAAGGTLTSAAGTTHNLGRLTLTGGTVLGTASPPAGAYTFTLNGPVTASGAIDATIGGSANGSANGSGGVGVRGPITMNVASGSRLLIPAPLGDAAGSTGAVVKIGPGTLVLSGTNTYAGGINVSAGTVSATPGSLGTGSILLGGTGTLAIGSDATVAGLPLTFAGGGRLTLANYASNLSFAPGTLMTLGAAAGTPSSLAGTIADNGATPTSLAYVGPGALTLTAANGYSGGTNVSAGTLLAANPAAIGSGAVLVTGGATLSAPSGLSTVTGPVTVNAATLVVGGSGLGSAGTLNLSNGSTFRYAANSDSFDPTAGRTVAFNGAVTVDTNGTAQTFAGVPTGTGPTTGTLAKVGAGTLTLAGSGPYGASTTVTGGGLVVAAAASLGTGTLSVSGAGVTLDLYQPAQAAAALSGVTAQPANGSATVTLHGTALTVNQSSSTTFNGTLAGTGSLTKLGAGTLTLAGPTPYAGPTNVAGGTLVFGVGPRTLAGGLAISGNAVVQLTPVPALTQWSLVTPTLSVATGTGGGFAGKLDLGITDLDVQGGSLAGVTSLAAAGFAGGRWTGTGLTSALAAADSRRLTAVGVIQNATDIGGTTPIYTTLDGQPATATDVLARYTYYGDADLDGLVNAADYTRVDAGFVMGLTGWQNGDFNYDGTVDGADYAMMDNAFNRQLGEIAAPDMPAAGGPVAAPAVAVSAVPEPASGGLLAAVGLGLLGRRRRCRTRPTACRRGA